MPDLLIFAISFARAPSALANCPPFQSMISMLCIVVLKGILVEVDSSFLSIKISFQTLQASFKTYYFIEVYDDIWTDGSYMYHMMKYHRKERWKSKNAESLMCDLLPFRHLTYVLHVTLRPNDYEITLILSHITGDIGDISIFSLVDLYDYNCLALNSSLTIKLNVNNPSSSL